MFYCLFLFFLGFEKERKKRWGCNNHANHKNKDNDDDNSSITCHFYNKDIVLSSSSLEGDGVVSYLSSSSFGDGARVTSFVLSRGEGAGTVTIFAMNWQPLSVSWCKRSFSRFQKSTYSFQNSIRLRPAT